MFFILFSWTNSDKPARTSSRATRGQTCPNKSRESQSRFGKHVHGRSSVDSWKTAINWSLFNHDWFVFSFSILSLKQVQAILLFSIQEKQQWTCLCLPFNKDWLFSLVLSFHSMQFFDSKTNFGISLRLFENSQKNVEALALLRLLLSNWLLLLLSLKQSLVKWLQHWLLLLLSQKTTTSTITIRITISISNINTVISPYYY